MVSQTLVVTAAAGSFEGLERAAANIGWSVVRRPLIRFEPPADWGPFDRAVERIDDFTAVAVTSPRAADVLSERLTRRPCRVPAWVVGDRSGSRLEGAFETIHRLTGNLEAEGRAEALAERILSARVASRVFFPCGSRRREGLIERLESGGGEVHVVVCYRTVVESQGAARGACSGADALLVASPSVAVLLADTMGETKNRPSLIVVGPTTADAARGSGWSPTMVAATPTTNGIRAALDSLRRARHGA